jgi:hypothetical protein
LLQPSAQSADVRVLAVAAHYAAIVCTVTGGAVDPLGERLLAHRLALEPRHLVEMATFAVRGALPDPRCTCAAVAASAACAFCAASATASGLVRVVDACGFARIRARLAMGPAPELALATSAPTRAINAVAHAFRSVAGATPNTHAWTCTSST